MAGKPIEIPITIDADGAERGAANVSDALEKVDDGLKDVNTSGEKAGKELAEEMSDAAKKIDRDLTKALEEVEDKAKSTGRTIGREVKDGTDKAGEGFKDMKDEAGSTAKEAAASFGSIEDSADALQEVLANSLSGFGPLGAAAGVAAAIGVGLLISSLTDSAEKINENKERMLGLAAEIRDVGGDMSKVDFVARMQEWGFAIQDTKEWFEVFQDDAKSGFDVVKEKSKEAGTSWQDAFKGAQGSMDDSLAFLKDTEGQFKDLSSEIDNAGVTYDEFGGSQSNASVQTLKQRDALKEQREAAQKNAEAIRDANRAAWDAINLGKDQNAVLEEQITLTNDVADAKSNAITSELDLADAQDALKEKLEASNAAYADNTKESRDNERAVIDGAGAINDWAQSQIDAGENADVVNGKIASQRDQLIDQATKFFGSRDAAAAYVDQLLKTPKTIDTDVNVNGIPDAEEKVRQFTNKGRHISVDIVTGSTYSVDNYIQGMKAGVTVPVDFAARGKPAIN